MTIYLSSLIFLFGLVVGSFLNCLIYRLEINKSVRGFSFCPKCKKRLTTKDLFPLFSFLFLKGRCRYCKEPISIQYPLVEFFTGIIFLLSFLSFYPILTIWAFLNFFLTLFIFSLLVVIFVYDAKHLIIPNQIIYPAIFASLLYALSLSFKYEINLFTPHLISASLAFLFFLLLYLLTKGKGIGFGDVRYAFFMGAFLGYPNVIIGLFFSYFLGGIVGIALLISGKKGRKSKIAFGPFLILGTFIAFFLGDLILNWYLSLIFQ